ncbi:MAG: hypothetical protein ACE5GX_07495 [Thermoanaerobaculia bacterium]
MSLRGRIGYVWGLGGIAFAVIDALIRLTPIAVKGFQYTLTARHWLFLAGWLVFMVLIEGYRGFHRSFSPRVVVRAEHLKSDPRWLDVILAPLFCSSLYRTTRRRLIASWGMIFGIVSVIVAVRMLPQPWRGLVDAGVVGGLTVGLLSMTVWFVRAQRGMPIPFSPELGEQEADEKTKARGLSQAPIS